MVTSPRTSHSIIAAVLLLAFSLTACDSATDDGADTTVEQDRENIESTLDQAVSFTRGWTEGAFSQKLKSFFEDGEGVDEDWIEQLAESFDEQFDLDADEEARAFLFDQHAGVYTWQPSTESWQRTAGAGAITLRFPSSPDAPTNDAEFRLTGYQDAAVTIDGETYRLPTAFSMEGTFDDERLVGLTVSGVTYSSDDPPYPTSASIELFTAPTTFTLAWTEASDHFDLDLSADDGEMEVALTLSLDLASGYHDALFGDDEDVEIDDVVEEAEGRLRVGEHLELVVEADIVALAALDDPTAEQINEAADASLIYDGQTIAHLEATTDEEGYVDDVMIVYKDDSQESVERFEDSLDELAQLIEDFVAQFEEDEGDF